jgi:WD40 repeat protein/serine/threonine protein kinase/tetratricopeptide (TPR) repeat protein
MSDTNPSETDPFGQIADEFLEAIRQGQRPSVEEFARRYPAHADEIRDILPALVMMEKAKSADDSSGPRQQAHAAAAAPRLSQLGDYQILREVGRGGMGVVYEAQQLSLGRHVAIKVLPSRALLDPRQLGRFQREARSAAKLHHTNIVPVFGVGEQDGLHYYVMQFIKGLGLDVVLDELRRLRRPRGKQTPTQADAQGRPTHVTQELSAVAMARGLLSGAFRPPGSSAALTTAPGEASPVAPAPGPLAPSASVRAADTSATIHLPGQSGGSTPSESGGQYWQSVARVGMQVADALAHAAGQGILHRDIKPSNLLLDDTGNVWVTDFGLAKAATDSDDLTHTGDIVGTLRYLAPERFEGPGDLRSDVYSLGLTLYEMLALRPAFDEADRNKLVKQVMHDEPLRPRKLNPGVPRDLETVVLKAIARDPAHRYQTPAEMADDLKRFVEDRPVKARRVSEAEKLWRWCRRNPLVASLLAGIVLVFLAGFAGVFSQWREAEAARKDEKIQRDRAEQSQKETADALVIVQSQKAKAVAAERVARAAEEAGRKLLYTTDMRLAPFVWKDDRTTAGQLRVLLAKHIPNSREVRAAGPKPDLRGFEWHYYQHLLEQSATVFSGHSASVVDGAYASNGQLVTLDEKGQVRRWDLASGAEDKASRHDLPGGPGAQVRVLSPNGRLAALADGNKVHVFDTSTGKEKFQIDSAHTRFRHLIFSRDGDKLVILDNKIRWCNASSGKVIASFNRKFDRVENLALSADGLTLAVVGHGTLGNLYSSFRLDAAAKGATPLAKDIHRGSTMYAAAFSPDDGRIAIGWRLWGGMSIVDTATGRTIAQHGSAHASPMTAMTFSGDGTKLATADAEGVIKIWVDARKLTSKSTALVTLKGHGAAIHSVGFSSDGKRLVTTSADKTARVWDLENAGAAIRSLERISNNECLVARFSPDGQLIAGADNRGSVRLWDAATGRLVRELPAGDKGRVRSVAFSPTDQRLLAVGYGGEVDVSHVALWDLDAGTELARLPGATDLPNFFVDAINGPVDALAFSPDGKLLAAGFGAKTMLVGGRRFPTPLKVWEVATRRLIRRLSGHTNYCVSLAFSPDGRLLASGSHDGTAIIWSTATWKAVHTLHNRVPARPEDTHYMRQMVEDVAFSPDGKTLALASRQGSVQLWDVAEGKLLRALKGHSSAVVAVAFSPDGRTLVSGGTDQTVRLWNVETRRELMQLDPGSIELSQVWTLAFSPDGKQLLAGGNGAAYWFAAPPIWNDPARAAAKLRLLLQSNADFRSRIRMLSENLRLHEALAKLDPKDKRVRAALAATAANWHASRQAWPEAAQAFDRLLAADPTAPAGWLRTPGLLRLATALVHQNRPASAAKLLQGGAKRRQQDGLYAAVDQVGPGINYSTVDGSARVTGLLPGSPAAPSGLLPGDVIEKVNATKLDRDSLHKLGGLLAGKPGTNVRLTIRHPGREKSEVIQLTRERFVHDWATGDLLYPLRAAIRSRLAKEPRNSGLLELRAELAGQWSDTKAQLADYTDAIQALSKQKPPSPYPLPHPGGEGRVRGAAADLKRLYGRRGNAYVRLEKWQEAAADFAHAVTRETTDEELLTNQARARAGVLLRAPKWSVLKPVKMVSRGGATLTQLSDHSIRASGVNPRNDSYKITAPVDVGVITALLLEAIPDPSMPGGGVGRGGTGSMALSEIILARVTAPEGRPTPVPFADAASDIDLSGAEPGRAIDGRDDTFFGVHPEYAQPHRLVLRLREPLRMAEKGRLLIKLEFFDKTYNRHGLGRFRLSVSGDPGAFDREQKLLATIKITDPWARLAVAYREAGDQKAIDELVARRPQAALRVGDLFAADGDWPRAVAIYSRGITPKTIDADLLSKRGRGYEALRKWDAAAADWSRAATGSPDGAELLAEFARRLAAAGQVRLASGQFDKAQALYDQALKGDPENEGVAAKLAQLLLDKNAPTEPEWVVLKPTATKTQGGAKLTVEDDGSILVEPAPTKNQQTVRWQLGPQPVRAVRIETSTHALPPKNDVPFFNESLTALAGMAVSRPGALRGQFVRLDLPGDNRRFPRHPSDKDKKTINLAELQVFHGDRNIALRKKVRQSSSLAGSRYAPENAVDGNTVGNDQGNPYAHTGWENDPWWEVDLGSEQPIDRIIVWNRFESGLHTRMNHFRVRVLDRSRKVVFEQVIAKAPNPSAEIVPQALLVKTKSLAAKDNPPLIVRLPRHRLKDVPARYRVSVATRLADLGGKRQAVMELTHPWAKLAGAYHMIGDRQALGKLLAHHPAARAGIGDLYALAQDWDRALAEYNRAIRSGSKDVQIFAARAKAHEQLGHWERAAADWARAAAGNPAGANLLAQFGQRLAAKNQLPLARAVFEKSQVLYEAQLREAVRRNPDNPLYHNNLGRFLDDRGRPQDAVAAFSEAILLQPENGEFRMWRGWAYADLGQWDKASADFVKAQECEQPHYQAWYSRAMLCLREGNQSGYRKICADMLQRFGKAKDRGAASMALWTCLLTPNAGADPAQLVRLAEKALAESLKDQWHANLLGVALYRAGRYEAAVKRLTEATSLNAGPYWTNMLYTWFFLAMAQHRLGHADEAHRWLEKATRATEEALRPPEKSGTAPGTIAPNWNRKLTLQLFRREAEELIQGPGSKAKK